MSTTQNQRPEGYGLVILGSGMGGIVAAWTFVGQGQLVAVNQPQRGWARNEVGLAAPPVLTAS